MKKLLFVLFSVLPVLCSAQRIEVGIGSGRPYGYYGPRGYYYSSPGYYYYEDGNYYYVRPYRGRVYRTYRTRSYPRYYSRQPGRVIYYSTGGPNDQGWFDGEWFDDEDGNGNGNPGHDENAWQAEEEGAVTLATRTDVVIPGQPFTINVYLSSPEGGYIQWDKNQPQPDVKWDLPSGWKADLVGRPQRQLYEFEGKQVSGYDRNAMLTYRITPNRKIDEEKVTIGVEVTYDVCTGLDCQSTRQSAQLPLRVGR